MTYRFPEMIRDGKVMTGYLNISLTVFVVACVCTILLWAVARWLAVWGLGKAAKPEPPKGGMTGVR